MVLRVNNINTMATIFDRKKKMKVIGLWSSRDKTLPVTPIIDPFVSLDISWNEEILISENKKKVVINILHV